MKRNLPDEVSPLDERPIETLGADVLFALMQSGKFGMSADSAFDPESDLERAFDRALLSLRWKPKR